MLKSPLRKISMVTSSVVRGSVIGSASTAVSALSSTEGSTADDADSFGAGSSSADCASGAGSDAESDTVISSALDAGADVLDTVLPPQPVRQVRQRPRTRSRLNHFVFIFKYCHVFSYF